jgi:hypothetical protein
MPPKVSVTLEILPWPLEVKLWPWSKIWLMNFRNHFWQAFQCRLSQLSSSIGHEDSRRRCDYGTCGMPHVLTTIPPPLFGSLYPKWGINGNLTWSVIHMQNFIFLTHTVSEIMESAFLEQKSRAFGGSRSPPWKKDQYCGKTNSKFVFSSPENLKKH